MTNAGAGRAGVIVSVAYAVGRGARWLRPAVGGASRVGPVVGGAAVAALWAVIYGCVNFRRHRKGRISKEKAVKKTVAKSVGVGLATGAGIMAVNAVRGSALAVTSSALVPFLVGTAVSDGAKAAWERAVTKRSSDPRKTVVTETGTKSNMPST